MSDSRGVFQVGERRLQHDRAAGDVVLEGAAGHPLAVGQVAVGVVVVLVVVVEELALEHQRPDRRCLKSKSTPLSR